MGFAEEYHIYGNDFEQWTTPCLEDFLNSFGNKPFKIDNKEYLPKDELSEPELLHLRKNSSLKESTDFLRFKALYDLARREYDDRNESAGAQEVAQAIANALKSPDNAPK